MENSDIRKQLKDMPETVKYPLSIIQTLGLYSPKKSKRVMILANIYLLSPVFLLTVNMIQFMGTKGDMSRFVDNMLELVAFGQLVGKCAVFTYYQSDFTKLVENMKQFWDSSECDKSIQVKLNQMSSIILRIEKLFTPTALIAVLFMTLSMFSGSSLPIGAWNIEGHDVLYYFVLVLQIPSLILCCIFICPFDCIYLAFCTELIAQFKILCCKLEHLGITGNNNEQMEKNFLHTMNCCIQHHVFLQRFIKEFQRIFSFALLIDYVATGPVFFVEMYALMESYNIQLMLPRMLTALCGIIQLCVYCIPADYVAEEALTVATAIYNSGWYLRHFASKRSLLVLITQNSQRDVTITAAGLIIFNSRTVLNVVKFSWSVCMMMRRLKEK